MHTRFRAAAAARSEREVEEDVVDGGVAVVVTAVDLDEDAAAREGPGHGERVDDLVDERPLVEVVVVRRELRPGQDKGDSTSRQRECSARARPGKSTHASRALREMIARPKISQNERKTAEI